MSASNLGSKSSDPLGSTIFALSHLTGTAGEMVRQISMNVFEATDESVGKDFAGLKIEKSGGYLPRNFHLSNGRAKTKGNFFGAEHECVDGDKIGSFRLYNTYWGTAYNEFQSETLGITLAQIESMSEVGWKYGLRLEPLEGSTLIGIRDLENFITSFVAYFIKKHNISWREVSVIEKEEEGYKFSVPDLPVQYDEKEKEEVLFSLRRGNQGETIYFTDLTPLHPDFIQELLLSLDRNFGH